MQSVTGLFTAAERSRVRNISAAVQVSWKKIFKSTYKPFTIGVSTIGSFDTIAASDVMVSNWTKYIYYDESAYLLGLNYERGLKMPTGGLSMGLYDVTLDNTTNRFTPRYMGGNSELFTSANKVMRPVIINAGFHHDGIDDNIPQFIGLTTKPPAIDARNKTAEIQGSDFIYYLQNNYLDQQVMFTSQRTDQVVSTLLTSSGLITANYDLDYGINIIPFGMFDVGTKLSDAIDQLVEAENGHFYQTESGVLKFENRQHWTNSDPIQRIIYTADVVNAQSPNIDHLINVVEVHGLQYEKQPQQLVWKLPQSIFVKAGATYDLFANFNNPMLSIDTPLYAANTAADGSGTTMSLSLLSSYKFAQAAKFSLKNPSATTDIYITSFNITGRSVQKTADVYTRMQDDSSVTAYQERPFSLTNNYIQNPTWAASYAQMILNDFSEPENLQVITILAKPELQMGDQISWQGRYWRIFDIKTYVDPSKGFLQELTLLQRTITSYFRIGISTIGNSDKIAP